MKVGMKTKDNIIFLPVIIGPTASGKTSLAIELSINYPIEVISADSRQIYKLMDIGTAKPRKDELEITKHHLIDYLFPNVAYSAGKFAEDALLLVADIIHRGKIPLFVGGTGFYLKAFFDGLQDEPDTPAKDLIRQNLNNMLKEKGRDYLYSLLFEIDNESALKNIDKNPQRIIRALEYYYTHGLKFSETTMSHKKHNYEPIYYAILPERKQLYNTINTRVDFMISNGLIDEVKYLLSLGYDLKFNSMKTVGYKEVISYLSNLITTDECIGLIKQNTRRYAKRQITWIRGLDSIIDVTNYKKSLNQFLQMFLFP